MGKFQRVFVIVLDSLGFGAMPDAEQYGDSNVDTIGHIAEKMQLHIPNLQKLGAANIRPINGVASVTEPLAKVTKLCEKSHGKDTMTGHWEMMGLYITKPFKTFTDTGFPPELIAELERQTGHKCIGNKSASGTVILDELGEEDKLTVTRARKLQKFLSQPFAVAENFTGLPGKYVPLAETVKGFAAIVDGKCDDLPEWAFFNVGTLDDARKKAADKLAEEKGGEA